MVFSGMGDDMLLAIVTNISLLGDYASVYSATIVKSLL